MNTTTAYKIRLMRDALKQGIVPKVTLRGWDSDLSVANIKNHGHTITLSIARGGGFIVCDPEEIQSVWLPKLPVREDESQFEVRVDD